MMDPVSQAVALAEAPPPPYAVQDPNAEPSQQTSPHDDQVNEVGSNGAQPAETISLDSSVVSEKGDLKDDDSRFSTYSSASSIFGDENALHVACCAFDLRAVDEVVRMPECSVHDTDKKGRNAVHLMVKTFCSLHKYDPERPKAKAKLEEIVGVLIKAGLDMNAQDYSSKRTPLQIAASFPDMADTIKTLLMAGSKVNLTGCKKQQTALHIAVEKGHLTNVEALVDGGADLNAKDQKGQTPVHLASTGKRHLPICQLLLGCGGDPNSQDRGGRTPLHIAAKAGRPELVKELLHGSGTMDGARVNMPDSSGQTAVHIAATYDLTGKVLQELMRKRADLNLPDFISCETPLHKAVKLNMLENIRALLCLYKGQVNPNLQDILGETPLHKAYDNKQLWVWQTLIKAGGDVNIRNENGQTPLTKTLKVQNPSAQCVIDANKWEKDQKYYL